MDVEQLFRWIFISIFVISLSISTYYRRKARMSGEVIPRLREGKLALLRLLLALPVLLVFLAYMINPGWMVWFTASLPVWVRWLGVGLGIVCVILVWWVFISIGSNISETVLTKKDHRLVKNGPYRWVRHPLYSVFGIEFIAFSLISETWLIGVFAVVAIAFLILIVVPKEEAELVKKFGEEYEEYRRRTGKLLPQIFSSKQAATSP